MGPLRAEVTEKLQVCVLLKGTATQLATNITVSGSRVEECSGVCALLCECVLDPHRKPFFVLCVEAAFLIRGHYMRLVPGSPGKGEGIRAQIRPSRPFTVPGHLYTETRPPPPPNPSKKIIKNPPRLPLPPFTDDPE